MTAPALETRDVSCVFNVNQGFMRGTRPLRAVNGVSLQIPKGQVVDYIQVGRFGKLRSIAKRFEVTTTGDWMIDP